MVKLRDNALYIFAAAMNNVASRPQFAVEGLDDSRAEVIGEQRSVSIRKGILEDLFGGYDVHIYRIQLNGR